MAAALEETHTARDVHEYAHTHGFAIGGTGALEYVKNVACLIVRNCIVENVTRKSHAAPSPSSWVDPTSHAADGATDQVIDECHIV